MPYLPKALDGTNNNKKRANKWEKKLAKQLNCKTTQASGAGVYEKGDLKSVEFVGESKKTQQDSMAIRREWLEKIDHEAKRQHKDWFVHIGFTDISDKSLIEGVLISTDMFNKLKDIIEEVNSNG
jgi:N-dimethylarginine dimethylaminohydrolase